MSTRCAGCILLPAQWRGAWVGREAGASMWGAPQELILLDSLLQEVRKCLREDVEEL